MTLTKTEKLARQRARRKIKKLSLAKSKWPIEWMKGSGRLQTLKNESYQLQLLLFRENSEDGWSHTRFAESVVSERSREGADADLTFNDYNYFA